MSTIPPRSARGKEGDRAKVLGLLAKCLERTASDFDGEALTALRKANELRQKLDVTWTDLLVVGANAPEQDGDSADAEDDDASFEKMFETIAASNYVGAKWKETIADIHRRYEYYGRLTPKQEALVRKIYKSARFACPS